MNTKFSTLLANALIAAVAFTTTIARAADPLSTWNDGAAKQSIVTFVEKVTTEDSPDFVPVPERIAVFDNDGTLWTEAPISFQAAFVFDEIKRRAPQDPLLAADPMVQAALAGDVGTLLAGKHHDGLMRILALTHAGMTTDEFDATVKTWFASARHPRFNKLYSELTYQPMQELLNYLRANRFKTFIVSGGGADFMRVWSEQVYGIPPENVVGSTAQTKFEMRDGKPVLIKTTESLFVDDKDGKPVGIHQYIGRRPIACFGNSDGDHEMLEYTTIDNPRPSFGLLVHHTDAEREYAYDEHPPSSGRLWIALKVAAVRDWTLVDMKADWNQIWSETATVDKTLLGNWLVEDIAGRGVIDNAQSTIEFGADGSVSGNTCVNRYSGKATINGQSIKVGPLAMTRRSGPPALMDQESRFTTALEQVTSFRIDDNGLLNLTDSKAQDILRLSKLEN